MVTPVLEAHIGRVDMLSRYLTSLHKVANLEVKALYHSHGPLRADHYERIAELETKQRRRAVEALEIVRSNPGATGNEVIRAMRWNTHAARWEDIDAAMRLCIIETGFVMLDHLTATGQATREMRDGFWRYFPC